MIIHEKRASRVPPKPRHLTGREYLHALVRRNRLDEPAPRPAKPRPAPRSTRRRPKGAREYAVCPACDKIRDVTLRGVLHVHARPGGGHCPGSGQESPFTVEYRDGAFRPASHPTGLPGGSLA